jgi:predicted nucleic acid-binding protein
MIFVDTGAWFALVVPTDPNHSRVVEWMTNFHEALFTTDYVVDETLTLLKARGEYRRSIEMGDHFFAGDIATVYRLNQSDLQDAWELFRTHTDKDWSFTDCTSKAVIDRLKIETALAFDKHFRQFGTVTVQP